ncbi:hypothetical protein GCM10027075_16410 [Streptomyces heilongjiangensis]
MGVDAAVHRVGLDDDTVHARVPADVIADGGHVAAGTAFASSGKAADSARAAAHPVRPRGRIRARDGHRLMPRTRIRGCPTRHRSRIKDKDPADSPRPVWFLS